MKSTALKPPISLGLSCPLYPSQSKTAGSNGITYPQLNQAVADQHASDIRQRAIQNAIRTGLLAFGGGLALRGVSGLTNLHRRNRRQRKPSVHSPVIIEYPVTDKTANDLTTLEGWTQGAKDLADNFTGFLAGEKATTPASWPLAIPLAAGAGSLGLYGGYRLADWLMDKRRKQELEDEYQAARRDYEAALAEKPASELGRTLDTLFDRLAGYVEWDKTASTKEAQTGWDALGYASGLGLTGLGALALGTGALTYNLLKKQTRPEVLRKARLRQRRQEAYRSPAPLLVLPSHQPGPDGSDDEETEG